jgi:ankyrin repeat protein
MQADGRTALHIAARNGHTDIVKALLAAGANVSATTTVRGPVFDVCVAARDASDVSSL